MENITNEVMNNEEVFAVAEDLVEMAPVKAGKGLKVAGVTVLVAAVGYGLYRAGKWAVSVIKDKKANGSKIKVVDADFEDVESDDE